MLRCKIQQQKKAVRPKANNSSTVYCTYFCDFSCSPFVNFCKKIVSEEIQEMVKFLNFQICATAWAETKDVRFRIIANKHVQFLTNTHPSIPHAMGNSNSYAQQFEKYILYTSKKFPHKDVLWFSSCSGKLSVTKLRRNSEVFSLSSPKILRNYKL